MSGEQALPSFQQVRYFAFRGDFKANAVGIDILNAGSLFCCDHQSMWMNDVPHLLNRMWFRLSVQKQALHVGLPCQVLGLAKGLLCLLIIVVGIMELKQAWRLPGLPQAQIEKDDWLPVSILDGCVNDGIIEFTLKQQHGQSGTGQVFLTMCERYGDIILARVPSIVEVGYRHTNEGDSSSKGCCQRLCHQIRGPCRYQECSRQQPYIEFEGVPGIEHHPPSIRRRRYLFWRWIARGRMLRWGRRLLRQRGRSICCIACSGPIISFKLYIC